MRILSRHLFALFLLPLMILVTPVLEAQEAMYVEDSGDVGVGTSTPDASLHVLRTDGSAQILVDEASTTTGGRSLFVLRNRGQINFSLQRVDAQGIWSFTHNGPQFTISKAGTGANEFSVFDNGDVEARGVITGNVATPSSRSLKTGMTPVEPKEILEKVLGLPILEWEYLDSDSTRTHIGPMAEDFNRYFQIGDDDKIFLVDANGVALAAIQGLHGSLSRELAEKDRRIALLEEEVESLEQDAQRLATLEMELKRMQKVLTELAARP